MKLSSFVSSTVLLAPTVIAQNDTESWRGSVYGSSSREMTDYLYNHWPYRNSTEYGLHYLTFNWSGPIEDNGPWTLRVNTADSWIPANLSRPGAEKAVVTSYALQWGGFQPLGNLSAKIANDTDVLQEAGVLQTPPNMCIGYMGFEVDWPDNVKRRMVNFAQDPCLSMFGDYADCSFDSMLADLPGCDDTWNQRINGTFLQSVIANGSQATNASAKSPMNDDEVAYLVQTHAADDNSTYERELMRTQIFMVRESGKEPQLLCARFESLAIRAITGAPTWALYALMAAALTWQLM